jgi:hypothetical protein
MVRMETMGEALAEFMKGYRYVILSYIRINITYIATIDYWSFNLMLSYY